MKHIKEKSASRKGDLAEYYAVTWLWDNGYEVFKNPQVLFGLKI